MIYKMIDQDIEETTKCLTEIICQKCFDHTHGTIKGYLIPNQIRSVISKEERKAFSSLDTQGIYNACHGSVKCSETNGLTGSLTAMIIAYAAKNNLITYFSNYPFKKFKIDLETYPKYRYVNKRFMKYRKTGDDITFLKVDIEW